MKDIAHFIEGFGKFHSVYFGSHPELFEDLKEGQNPKAMMIGCSDSRVDPAILVNSSPGDLFVARNVANLVPPYQEDGGYHGVSAALEFAVRNLEVQHVIVMGHSQCGGIRALMQGIEDRQFVSQWVQIAQAAKEEVLASLKDKPPELQARACEEAAILLSLENLATFPWVAKAVEAGELTLHGWYFDLAAGELLAYDPESLGFAPVKPASA